MRLIYITGVLSMTLFAGCLNSAKDKDAMTLQELDTIVSRSITSPADITSLFPKTVKEVESYAKLVQQLAKQEFDNIVSIAAQDRTFDNTIRALDESNAKLYKIEAVLELLSMISPDEGVRKASHEASVLLSQFSIETFMTKKLYQAYQEYAGNKGRTEILTAEERYSLEESLKSLERVGLGLPDKELEEVKELNKEISKIGLEYDQNINTDKTTIRATKAELEGVDEALLMSLQKDGDAFVLGCDSPTYFEVMQNCHVGETRKRLYKAFNNRAYPKNIELLHQLIAKRDVLARRLGFASFAALDTNSSMAKTPQRVENFLTELAEASGKKASREKEELKRDLPQGVALDGKGRFYPWDLSYVTNAYKKKHFSIDERILAEYFPMEKALQGMLSIYEEFLSVTFSVVKPDWSWHPDVQLVETRDKETGKLLGYVFLDLYPRENKYSHACCGAVIKGYRRKNIETGKREDVPYVGIMLANFPKATADRPALLKHSDVETFFHEFGHAIHGILGRTELAGNAGTSVKRDFVELPSQMLEEWMWDKAMLAKVSSHYKTGNSLPADLIEKKLALKKFDVGSFVLRQVWLSLLSLNYFLEGAEKDTNVITKHLHEQLLSEDAVFDPDTHFQASFGHLVGYGAKYYGYMWSRVFALDAFYKIKEHGLLNYEDIGKQWREIILGHGGGTDPNELLVKFLGREPNQEAFFKDCGFIE